MDEKKATEELFKAIYDYPQTFNDPEDAEKNLPIIAAALEAGADWTAPLGPGNYDAAFSAALCWDEKPLALLLAHGVPVSHSTEYGATLLHRAAEFGRTKCIRFLVKNGAAVDARNKQGRRPIDEARGSKHGKPAVALLTRLTMAAAKKAAKKAAAAKKSAKGKAVASSAPAADGDLTKEAMTAALKALPARSVTAELRRALVNEIDAAFAGKEATTSEDFLGALAQSGDLPLLAAAVNVVRNATTLEPKKAKHSGEDVALVHIGDLSIAGDCAAISLVVTGNLTVKGRLTNWEGRVVCVGGTLKADTVVTEGPLWVGEELQAKRGMFAFGNDYSTIVKGPLTTKVLIQEEHQVRARPMLAEKRYRKPSAIPEAERARLAKLLRVRL